MKRFFTLFITLMMVFGMTTFAGATPLTDLGGGLIYDEDQNITWLQYATGPGDWYNAMDWAANLDYAGVTDWRLPRIKDVGLALSCAAEGCSDYQMAATSELAYLYYSEYGIRDGNTDPFTGLQTYENSFYWLETEFGDNGALAWHFSFYNGSQEACQKTQFETCYAMAVYDGNAAPVPEPSTLLLLGSGLVSVATLRIRRRRRNQN